MHLLESAKSSLTFELIQNQETVKSLSDVSLLMRLNTLDDDYHKYDPNSNDNTFIACFYLVYKIGNFRTLLKRVAGITLDDIKMVGATYLPVLIDATKARLAVCCHPSKGKEVVAGFKRYVILIRFPWVMYIFHHWIMSASIS